MKFAAPSIALIVFGGVWLADGLAAKPDDPELERSRELVQTFGMRLKAELKNALEEGGPVRAVSVCKDIAPKIASDLSRRSGAKVMRTSLRYRNPANAPEPWQARVLSGFEEGAENSVNKSPLEYFAREDDGTIRYMRAIRTDGVCLACHGVSIPQKLQQNIDTEYPHDRAVGYNSGDVRGAFSITWPPPE